MTIKKSGWYDSSSQYNPYYGWFVETVLISTDKENKPYEGCHWHEVMQREYWVWENSEPNKIDEDQAQRMLGFVSIFPTREQCKMFGPNWDKR